MLILRACFNDLLLNGKVYFLLLIFFTFKLFNYFFFFYLDLLWLFFPNIFWLRSFFSFLKLILWTNYFFTIAKKKENALQNEILLSFQLFEILKIVNFNDSTVICHYLFLFSNLQILNTAMWLINNQLVDYYLDNSVK